jgi:oxygen-dependent protoporphyrinogen oxidase
MKIVVVGAGIAGLGIAYYLSRKSHNVTVLEASSVVGGRSRSISMPGTNNVVDTGTQFFHSNYPRAFSLLKELGLDHGLSRVKGYTRIFDERLASGYFHFNQKLPWYRPEGLIGNLQIGKFLLGHLKHMQRDPFCLLPGSPADNLPGLSDSMPASVTEAIVRPVCLVGALAEPETMNISLHHLMRLIRIVLTTRFLKLDGGINRFHHELASRLPVILDAPVASLSYSQSSWDVSIEGSDRIFGADHVILATPPDIAAKLLPNDFNEEKPFLESIKSPPFVLPTFFLDRPMNEGIWSYLLHRKQRGLISYITDASQFTPDKNKKAIIQPWICYPYSSRLVSSTDSEITNRCLDELDGIFPGISSWVLDVCITRHARAVPFHPVSHQRRSLEFLQRLNGKHLSICGDYLSGGFMEAALWSAEYVAGQLG